jgi:hypothetical protein
VLGRLRLRRTRNEAYPPQGGNRFIEKIPARSSRPDQTLRVPTFRLCFTLVRGPREAQGR